MWPAIFLFLKTRPGSWRLPVEPCERCDSDTPWVARRPPKSQRFMRAGEALALGHARDVDQLAGNEVIGADLRADIEQRVFIDAELDDAWPWAPPRPCRNGARCGLATFFAFAVPAPSWTAV